MLYNKDVSTSKPKLPFYLAVGCGLSLLLLVLGIFGLRWYIGSILNRALNPAPVKFAGTYTFGYPASPCVSLLLPDNATKLTYMHFLVSPKNSQAGEGERALRIVSAGKSREWPLPYSHLAKVRVGLYWYPATAGKGPCLLLYDATGESVLDLGRGRVGMLRRVHGKSLVADYEYNNQVFEYPAVELSGSDVTKFTSISGKPATDLTSVITPTNCRYLGSIVQYGKMLRFVRTSGVRSVHRP